MNLLKELVFRELTDADFFNINKPSGIEDRGGGQSYIDINTSVVTLRNWYSFFSGVNPEHRTNGPRWNFIIRSLGVPNTLQSLTIAQRRPASVSIRSQKIRSTQSQRVNAWRPGLTGFPDNPMPSRRVRISNLRIYIAKLDNGEYWAGWFQAESPAANWYTDDLLNLMFRRSEGYLDFDNPVSFNTDNADWPFEEYSGFPQTGNIFDSPVEKEGSYERVYFDEDELIDLPEATELSLRRIRKRNQKATRKLKVLYNNRCQISGDAYSFKKKDGTVYSEAHHLISLGQGGSDSVKNIVILSPLIHRMLHYAKVEGIDLSQIADDQLSIKINDQDYTISWHPDHGQIVRELI